MKDLMLVVLVFEHAMGKRWFVESHHADAGEQYTASDVHFRARRIIADRVAVKKTGAMRLRAAAVVALPMTGTGSAVPQLEFVMAAEKGMETQVTSDAVPAFAANDLRPPAERLGAFVQMKVDAAVAQGYRPISVSLTVAV